MSQAKTRRILNSGIDFGNNEIARVPNTRGRIVTLAPKREVTVSFSDCIAPEARLKIEGVIRGQEAQIKGESFSVFSARDVHSAIAVLMEQVWVAGNIKDISYKVAGYLMGNYDIPMIIKASRWLLDGMRAGYSLEKTKVYLYDMILSSNSINWDLLALEIVIAKMLLGEMDIPTKNSYAEAEKAEA
ncbi:MAG: hypothetical protein WA103_05095 [Minisyncoccales bacterium]